MQFDYIIEKINNTELSTSPFLHLELNNLFTPEHFEQLVRAKELNISDCKNDKDLFEKLFNNGYKIIDFPGCINDHEEYIKWHEHKHASQKINTACEGFGIVLRLKQPESTIVRELTSFLESDEFIQCISRKFGVQADECNYDSGIQKYLDGYEISPHPDIRRKALTYMVNLNPSINSELSDHHTYYMKFKPEYTYIREYWKGNKNVDTCWVPWEWCNTVKQQTKNNSIVIFSPNNETLHAVKAKYDHLQYQRTQLYGNLWYKENPCDVQGRAWESLVIDQSTQRDESGISRLIPWRIKNYIEAKKASKTDKKNHATRDY